MRFGINLRGDLAKLDDEDIALRLKSKIAEREWVYGKLPALQGNKWLYQKGLGAIFGRGLFHARIFYKMQGLGYYTFQRPSLYDLYLLDCELKDLKDEIKRRVRWRKLSVARS